MSCFRFILCPPAESCTRSKRNLLQTIQESNNSSKSNILELRFIMNDYQGVLYKRRDIFTRQWRPRWFVLQPQIGILTYYLFSSNEPAAIVVGSTPRRRSNSNQESVEYDVVPRGTIYLRGCQVHVADDLSRPADDVYCFVITAPDSNAPPCCLATTTAESREEWVTKISQACGMQATESSSVVHGENDEDEAVEGEVELIGESSEVETGHSQKACWHDAEPGVATAGLTPDVKTKIDAALAKYLPYTDDDGTDWSILFEDKNGVTAYQQGQTMIKSVAIVDHHPKQIFNLVADIKRRREYEKNVRTDERLKRCNSHTFIDYYAYQPVWPTMAREFLILFHWRVLKRQSDETAIVMIGFSYPEGNDLRPSTDDHVRADLEISLFLLELCEGSKTRVTRVISYDLCGNIPRSLTKGIIQQQATMPWVIASFLKTNEPHPPSRLRGGDITDSILANEIIDRLPDEADGLDCVRRRLQFESSVSSTIDDETPLSTSDSIQEGQMTEEDDTPHTSKLLITLILLTPLVIYNLLEGFERELPFLVSAFIALRTVVLLKLGTPVPEQTYSSVVSCSFSVNLRGFLRFLAKRREGDTAHEGQEPSVVPVVVKAIGRALTEIDGVNCQKMCIPLLGVSGCFLRQDVSVSVLSSTQTAKEEIITISDVSNLTIEQISLEIAQRRASTPNFWMMAVDVVQDILGFNEVKAIGSCLVVTSPDSDGHEIDLAVAPSDAFNAIIVIGGLRLTKQALPMSIASPTPRKPPKPLLAITISVNCPACSIPECRRFAERVKELIEVVDI